MSLRNRVIWSEGLFLQPHHFQQHVRYVEHFVGSLYSGVRPQGWGFSELSLDEDLLRIGKFAVSSAKGVFPDGTPFNIPQDDAPPTPLQFDENIKDATVYLSLPLRRERMPEVANGADDESLARYVTSELDVADVHTSGMPSTLMQVGKLRTRLLLDKDQREEHTSIGVARVIEQQSDKNLLLQREYIPTVLDCMAAPRLMAFIREVLGVLHSNADELASRVAGSGRGVAEVQDFLLLLLLNRFEPLFAHFDELRGLHPEELFRELLKLVGELSTLRRAESRRPIEYPKYVHHDLRASFEPIMRDLRTMVAARPAAITQQFELQDLNYGIYNAELNDKNLLGKGRFILAVKADISTEELMSRVPDLLKLAPLEGIQSVVQEGVRGIPFRALTVAPRQIPFHSGFAYFEIERRGTHWDALENSVGIGVYVPEKSFPGLDLELWWIGD